MNHLKLIHEFLEDKRSLSDLTPSGNPFVTISRQAGAGGHLLAHVILVDFLKHRDDELFRGWHVFDRQLCEVIAGDPALQATMEALLAEEYRSELTAFVETLCTGCAGQDRQYRKIFEVVRVLASIGKVILVGRAAAFVTRDLPGGIHVRLVAPEPLRVRWMMRKLSLERSAALKLIRRQDRDRDRMARRFFNADVADPLHYDAVWNSGKASPHEMSESIISMTRLRARQAEKARQEAEARND